MTKLISDKRISKPWVANELFKCIKQRSSNFKLLKLGLMDAQIYNSYRNYVTKKIRNSEKSYYLNTFENSRNNPRQTWLTIKEILGHKKVSSDMKLVEDGREICDAREIAQGLYSEILKKGNKSLLWGKTGVNCIGIHNCNMLQ